MSVKVYEMQKAFESYPGGNYLMFLGMHDIYRTGKLSADNGKCCVIGYQPIMEILADK